MPENSILNANRKKYDYIDSFHGVINDYNNEIKSQDVGKAFFTSSPSWVEKLFVLRNKIVSVFGLKTPGQHENRQKQLDNFKCEPGDQMGLFKVFDRTDDEVILGEDDKHLNFRVSLFLAPQESNKDKKDFTITTAVEFNNRFGRLYFLPVRPFHQIIVPSILKGIIRNLEKQTGTDEKLLD